MSTETNASTRSLSILSMAAAAFIFAILALAAACSSSDDGGNGDNGDNGDESPTATQAAGDGDGDGNGDDDPTETPDDGDGDGDGDGNSIFDRINDLSDDYENIEAKVVYDFTVTSDEEDGNFDTVMTLVSRPPSDSRVEYELEGTSIISISTSDASYSCFSGDGEDFCVELGTAGFDIAPLPFFGDFTDADQIRDAVDDETDVDVDEFSDNIAGEDVNCFKTTGDIDGDDGEATWCFTDDGILLLSSFSGSTDGVESTFEMRATSFDRNVSDSDFEPPYDEFDLGDIPDIGDIFD